MNAYFRCFLASLLFVAADVAAQHCQDIGTVDFRKAVIQPRPDPGVLDEQFRFSNGVFEEALKPGGAAEWSFRIAKDLTVRPDPHITIRFLQISGDHLGGTGTRNYVLGFRCADGEVKTVFQKEGEALLLVSATSDGVQVSSPVWKSSDAHCCPSGERKSWFSWDEASGVYVEKDSRTLVPRLR
jgi:hypothetical protein